ncbi:MAG: FAD-dependent oxidoreductase [Hyphomicrobiales bacterium]
MLHVLGAGIVGVMTAYHLAEDGHEVTVIDREAEAAEGCSFGNAGLLAAGHSSPWAGPGAPRQMVKAALGLDPAIKIGGLPDAALAAWGIAFLGECTASAHARNSGRLARLSRLSRELTRDIGERLGLDYAQQHEGSFYLFGDRRSFDEFARAIEAGGHADDFIACDAAGVVAREPAFARLAGELAGGFLSLVDSSGDCRRFTRELAGRLSASGKVTFRHGVTATSLRRQAGRITAIETDAGAMPTAGVVVALGTATPALLKPFGIRVPIVPVRGYSASFPILDADRAPRLSAIDEVNFVGLSRLGDILRVTAIAEFASRETSVPQHRADYLSAYAQRVFGDAIDVDNGSFWTGARPATPAGPPFLGRIAGIDNLYINAGHGTLGWTMSAASGRLIADRIAGRAPMLADVSSTAAWLEGC